MQQKLAVEQEKQMVIDYISLFDIEYLYLSYFDMAVINLPERPMKDLSLNIKRMSAVRAGAHSLFEG